MTARGRILDARVRATAGLIVVICSVGLGALLAVHDSKASRAALRAASDTDVVAVPERQRATGLEHVVVLGDSVATGAGCDCHPFGPRLAQLLADRGHRAVRVSTLAHDGLTTHDLLQQLDADASTRDNLRTATAVTVTIAANDFDAGEAAGACGGGGTACYAQTLRALRPQLTTALRRIRVLTGAGPAVLVTGYWNVFLDGEVGASQGATYQRTSAALTQQVNQLLRESAAAAGATYVDLYAAFRVDGAADDTALLASDGDHPSAAGHQRIAEVLADYLDRG